MSKIHLACFLAYGPNGHGTVTWKHPRTGVGFSWDRPDIFIEMAKVCERGKFDMMLFADALGVHETYGGSMDSYLRHSVQVPIFDPMPLIAQLAGHTQHIGLTATMSTTYYPPFLLARLCATIDHLSRGRMGWNVVTSFSPIEAQNFGLEEMLSHEERYERAEEYLELCRQLWDSWEADAVIMDKEHAIFADPSKVHQIHFSGKYFKSRGPLTVPRSPQGRPAIVQAGASEKGRDYAAKHADAVFAIKNSIEDMKSYYDDVKERMVKYGRDPEECKIFFGVQPVIGETEEAAWRKQQQLLDLSDEEAGLAWISGETAVDLSPYPLDEPLPPMEVKGLQGKILQYYGSGKKPTLREIARHDAVGTTWPMVGTAEQVATQIEEVVRQVGGDGFAIIPTYWPSSLTEFVEMVVPILQEKRLFRKEYAGQTLKDHLRQGD